MDGKLFRRNGSRNKSQQRSAHISPKTRQAHICGRATCTVDLWAANSGKFTQTKSASVKEGI
jgi:hypothetical protein